MQEETFGGAGCSRQDGILCKLLQHNNVHQEFLERLKEED